MRARKWQLVAIYRTQICLSDRVWELQNKKSEYVREDTAVRSQSVVWGTRHLLAWY